MTADIFFTRERLAEIGPAETVDKVADGITDLAQDALGKLTALEERWAEEDRLRDAL